MAEYDKKTEDIKVKATRDAVDNVHNSVDMCNVCVDNKYYTQVFKDKKNPPLKKAENMGYLLHFGTPILT